MTDPDIKPEVSVSFICTECGDLVEVADVRALLRAMHLDRYCPDTEGVLHGAP